MRQCVVHCSSGQCAACRLLEAFNHHHRQEHLSTTHSPPRPPEPLPLDAGGRERQWGAHHPDSRLPPNSVPQRFQDCPESGTRTHADQLESHEPFNLATGPRTASASCSNCPLGNKRRRRQRRDAALSLNPSCPPASRRRLTFSGCMRSPSHRVQLRRASLPVWPRFDLGASLSR